jgi:hypothetical protein
MSGAVGLGDFVICDPPAGYRLSLAPGCSVQGRIPERGGIYQVREVGSYASRDLNCLRDGLRLVGIVACQPGHPDAWWAADCFRPISGGQRGMFDELLRAPDFSGHRVYAHKGAVGA